MSVNVRACLAWCLPALLVAAVPALAQTVSLNQGGQPLTITVGGAAILPADFPDDVFVPPSARLLRVEQAGAGRVLLDFKLHDTPVALAKAYSTAMAAAGWQQAGVAPVAGMHVQAWEKGSRAVVFSAGTGPDGTRLRLQLLPRRAAVGPAPL